MTPPTSWLPLPGWMYGLHSTESLSELGRKFPNAPSLLLANEMLSSRAFPLSSINGCFVLVFRDVDPAVEHGEIPCYKISDRVPLRFFAGHSLVRYTPHTRYPAHSCLPAKTEAQFFRPKHFFNELICTLCLLALLSHLPDETTSGFYAVPTTIQNRKYIIQGEDIMNGLTGLQPQRVFQFFESICRIPHGSGNVSALVDYCVQFAEEQGLSWTRDSSNNLVIRKSGSIGYENSDVLILQGHTDMVCEKDTGVEFDFEKDSIVPFVDGDWIRANGTTLGGDNGIAIAMCLALLEDNSLEHPPLEVLFTSDEEVGMLGAFAFDCRNLSGHKLINLDSEREGVLMCSCAGGANVHSIVPIQRESKSLPQITLEISGLKSGHSGVEIDKGRANANVLMTRVLNAIAEKTSCQLAELNGGTRETAIAPKSKAILFVPANEIDMVLHIAASIGESLKKEYASTEPDLTVATEVRPEKEALILTVPCTKRVVQLLLALPDGVQAMSMDMLGLVQTSVNFGVLELHEQELFLSHSVRSSMTTQKKWVLDRVKAAVTLAGGDTDISGNYPGWAYNPSSVVKDTIVNAYRSLFGVDAKIDAVHAGIECGLFADSIEDLDCVSIGPDMEDVHTSRERLSISSVQRTYMLLKKVLKDSK